MTALSNVIEYDQMQKIIGEFKRLKDRCYLDNAGATLYPNNLILNVNEDLANHVYMNPHTDKYTRDCIEQMRVLVLKHFNADPSNYTVIFTSGTTQSLKLVVESFQFANENSDNDIIDSGSFVYLQDNHTSVLGLREIAADKNVDIVHISRNDFLNSLSTKNNNSPPCKGKYRSECNTLFVYPAQSNFNGCKYPIDCIQKIKNGCLNSHIRKQLCKINCNWYVLLDAASFVPTSKLDLAVTQPDFICLSFYKMFGYPTGLGALIVKNSSSQILSQKKYFGGGTVDIVLSTEDFHVKRKEIHERFEDGTLPYLSVISLKHCFDAFHSLIPKVINNSIMDTIAYHTFYLAKDLHRHLKELCHPNRNRAAVLYMDTDFTDILKQGSIVTFNILREDRSYVGYAEFQHMADLFNISVRTGCFCNSGSCQRHLNVTNKEMKDIFKAGHKCGDEIDLVNGRPTGAVRVSFGYYNTYDDVDKLILMICRCFVKASIRKPLRTMCATVNDKYNFNMEDTLLIREKQICTKDMCYESAQCTEICDSKAVLKEIAIFPIKSCGAFKIKSAWKIGSKGFEYDREWMIIRDNGVCLTQKQNTKMCMIRPTIDLNEELLILSFKGMSSISIPLDPLSGKHHKTVKFCQSKICTDFVEGYDCGNEIAQWISEALEISYLRLIKQSSADNRTQKKKGSHNPKLSLSNQAQYLLINKATIRWLKDKIRDQTFSDNIDQLTDRFRGNLIIDMEEELIEREWKVLIIGNHEFKVDGQCSRCYMVCIDQQTGEKTVEPLRTIAEQFAGKAKFGIYLTYVGPTDDSTNNMLETDVLVQPINTDDDISRFELNDCKHKKSRPTEQSEKKSNAKETTNWKCVFSRGRL